MMTDIDFIDQLIERTDYINRFGSYSTIDDKHSGDYDFVTCSIIELFDPSFFEKLLERMIVKVPHLAKTICSNTQFPYIDETTKESLKQIAVEHDPDLVYFFGSDDHFESQTRLESETKTPISSETQTPSPFKVSSETQTPFSSEIPRLPYDETSSEEIVNKDDSATVTCPPFVHVPPSLIKEDPFSAPPIMIKNDNGSECLPPHLSSTYPFSEENVIKDQSSCPPIECLPPSLIREDPFSAPPIMIENDDRNGNESECHQRQSYRPPAEH